MISLVDAILKRVPEAKFLRKDGEISSGKWVQIVHILLHSIETESEDVNTSLQQFQGIALDVNELSTQTLVELQRVTSQEVVDQE